MAPVVPADVDPSRVVQLDFSTVTHGPVRVWCRGGVPVRLRVAGRTFTRAWDGARFGEWMRDPEVQAGIRPGR